MVISGARRALSSNLAQAESMACRTHVPGGRICDLDQISAFSTLVR